MIPYSKQSIDEADISRVVETLKSPWLTQGPQVKAFERALSLYCGADDCLVVCNATAALQTACLALNVGPGDVVLTSPITFVASANAARYCGADVDFVDIDPKTLCLCPKKLEEKLALLASEGRHVKAIIPVHFAGQSCDMKAIADVAKRYDVAIIEDASHALGGQYLDMPVGCGRFSDFTVFSFHPVKMITTGEGGALLSNRKDLLARARLIANHGVQRDHTYFEESEENDWFGDWGYQQISLGFNFRITDIQCALGVSQLNHLDDWVKARNLAADYYQQSLSEVGVITQYIRSECKSSYHLFAIRLPAHKRRQTYHALRERGYAVNVHYIPVHTQPYYRKLGFQLGDFPAAENYYREALSLPLFPGIDERVMDNVVHIVRALLDD